MKEIKRSIRVMSDQGSEREKLASLKNAFELFTHETAKLEASYMLLNDQFKTISHELQEANHQLQGKVAALDIVTSYLRGILDNISQGILFVDFNGSVITYNRAAEEILGIPCAKVLFEPYWNNFSDDLFGFSVKEILKSKKYLHAPSPISYESPDHRFSELEVDVTFVLHTSPSQHLFAPSNTTATQGMIIMLRDVTEELQLQQIASRADRMKELGEIAAHVAHEIRNPLGGIKGFASLLKRDLEGQNELQKMASSIVEGARSLDLLVNQVLQYSRPVQPKFESTDLVPLLQDLKQHLLADSNIRNVAVNINSSSKKAVLNVDPFLIRSALLNLLINAVQAMPHGGEIEISLNQSYGNMILQISDNGIGISEKNRQKLFTPFFTTKSSGTGQGLPEVQKVVQAHHGVIDVKSEEGKGTTFIIKLPINKGRH